MTNRSTILQQQCASISPRPAHRVPLYIYDVPTRDPLAMTPAIGNMAWFSQNRSQVWCDGQVRGSKTTYRPRPSGSCANWKPTAHSGKAGRNCSAKRCNRPTPPASLPLFTNNTAILPPYPIPLPPTRCTVRHTHTRRPTQDSKEGSESGREVMRKGFVSGRDQKDPKRMGRVLLDTMIFTPTTTPPQSTNPRRK